MHNRTLAFCHKASIRSVSWNQSRAHIRTSHFFIRTCFFLSPIAISSIFMRNSRVCQWNKPDSVLVNWSIHDFFTVDHNSDTMIPIETNKYVCFMIEDSMKEWLAKYDTTSDSSSHDELWINQNCCRLATHKMTCDTLHSWALLCICSLSSAHPFVFYSTFEDFLNRPDPIVKCDCQYIFVQD